MNENYKKKTKKLKDKLQKPGLSNGVSKENMSKYVE